MPSRAVSSRVSAAVAIAFGGAALLAQQPAPTPPAPQEPPPVTFRVEVDYVEVDAVVTDAQGNVVTGLTKDDFEVLEDGKPQKVADFSLVNIPIERAERPLFAAGPIEDDVQTNERVEGRVYLLVLDDLHTDFTRTPRVKNAARRFIQEQFGVNDLAAVAFTGRSGDAQDFTNNPRLLLAAIDRFNGRKLTSATIQRLEGIRTGVDGLQPGDDMNQMERAFNARNAMNTVRRLADFMAGVRGRRKALVLIGEGVDFDIAEATGVLGSTASAVLQDTQDAIASATRGNVSIYALDPRGLTTGDEDLIGVSSTMPEQGVGLNSLQNELRLSQQSLRVLATGTGGFAALNRNDLGTAFERIVRENSAYYLLGFYSDNSRRAGRYRKLDVRVKRPGLQVRSRAGYFEPRGRRPTEKPAAPGTLAPAVADALGSPLPVAGVPLKVFAGAYKGTAPNAAVALAIELDASVLDFVEKDGIFNETVHVAQSAYDAQGKFFPGDRNTLTLTFKPDTLARARAAGLRVVTQMNLPPGRYQLRVAAGNNGGKAGSVLYDLEVPDFYKAPFAMSGVSLTSAASMQAPSISPKAPLKDFLPGPPVAAREFPAGDTLALFAEVYENARGGPAHVIDLRADLRDERGQVVRNVAEERSSTELRGTSGGGYGFAAQIPLAGLQPGVYVLRVSAQSRAGDRPQASRDIQIRIR